VFLPQEERIMNGLGERIKEKRLQAGLTQEELAERIHTTRQTVSNYELGNSEPRLDAVSDIAEALGCRPAELIGDAELSRGSNRYLIVSAALLAAELVILLFIDPALRRHTSMSYDGSLSLISFFVVQNILMLLLGFFLVLFYFDISGRKHPELPSALKIVMLIAAAAIAFLLIWAFCDFLRAFILFKTHTGGEFSWSSSPVSNILMQPLYGVFFSTFAYRLLAVLIGALYGIPDWKQALKRAG